MAITKEDLVGIPAGELREWGRAAGSDPQAYDQLYTMWLEANSIAEEPSNVTESTPE